jgi:hypothetical protein
VECAVVKAKDGLPKLLRVETIETTYFEVETNVWGAEPNGKYLIFTDLLAK